MWSYINQCDGTITENWLIIRFITVTSKWARWHLKSPASPLFNQPFIQAQIKENIKVSHHKGQWCRALMFPLICALINGWVNNHEAGDLRWHLAHYDVTVMRDGLTQCPLVMPYGCMEFGQSWLRYWLGAIGHQAITWTKIDHIQRWIYLDLSSVLEALLHSHEGSFNRIAPDINQSLTWVWKA